MSYKTVSIVLPRGPLFDECFGKVGDYEVGPLRTELLALADLAPASEEAEAIYIQAAHRPHPTVEFTEAHRVIVAYIPESVVVRAAVIADELDDNADVIKLTDEERKAYEAARAAGEKENAEHEAAKKIVTGNKSKKVTGNKKSKKDADAELDAIIHAEDAELEAEALSDVGAAAEDAASEDPDAGIVKL